MRTLAVTPYGRVGGSSRVRVYEWADRFSDTLTVHSYTEAPSWSTKSLLRRPKVVASAECSIRRQTGVSRLLLHRFASPFGRGSLERALLGQADWGVYDIDDALFVPAADRSALRAIWPNPARATAAAGAADLVIAGNAYLADWAEKHCRRVAIIPSCVDTRAYTKKDTYTIGDTPLIGWIGSKSTERYLSNIGSALLAVHDAVGARLQLLGSSEGHLGELEGMIDRIPWTVERQAALIARWDIGIMPLDDTPWSRGKCAYKVLQYGAAALPVIASPVGANIDIINGSEALPASTISQWRDSLMDVLAAGVQERTRMGSGLHSLIVTSFSFDAWARTWERAVFAGL